MLLSKRSCFSKSELHQAKHYITERGPSTSGSQQEGWWAKARAAAYCLSKEEAAQCSWVGQGKCIAGHSALTSSEMGVTVVQVPDSKQMIPSHKITSHGRIPRLHAWGSGGGFVLSAQGMLLGFSPVSSLLPNTWSRVSLSSKPGTNIHLHWMFTSTSNSSYAPQKLSPFPHK